jgi:hypothetical protein
VRAVGLDVLDIVDQVHTGRGERERDKGDPDGGEYG